MKLADWTVLTDKENHRHYFYGPLNEFEPEDYEGLISIPVMEFCGL